MEQLIVDRRALHRIPELDRALTQTMAYLRAALGELRCTLSSPIPGSVCAYFDNGAHSTLALRSDADALPIAECAAHDYVSQYPPRMHACGHDGHMAMLLELARRMQNKRAPRNLLLIFQPAEETTGGARDICQSGILEKYNVEAIFGMHLWPDLPFGTIATRAGEMMSRSCELTVDIEGKSAHIARAEEGIDALDAGVTYFLRAREIVDHLPKDAHCLLRFGRMESGSVRNAVSARTHMEGSLRTFRDDVFYDVLDKLRAVAREIALTSGCRIDVQTSEGYPAVMNPPDLVARLRALGLDFADLEKPVMITEDFSWYQRSLPGVFFFLGIGPAPALHAANFNFDERALKTGADFWEQLALNFGRDEA